MYPSSCANRWPWVRSFLAAGQAALLGHSFCCPASRLMFRERWSSRQASCFSTHRARINRRHESAWGKLRTHRRPAPDLLVQPLQPGWCPANAGGGAVAAGRRPASRRCGMRPGPPASGPCLTPGRSRRPGNPPGSWRQSSSAFPGRQSSAFPGKWTVHRCHDACDGTVPSMRPFP